MELRDALPTVSILRKNNFNCPEDIAKGLHADLKIVFTDEKILKQVVNAAKRVSNPKKKATPRTRTSKQAGYTRQPADETTLALPESDKSEEDLINTIVETNRAPLFLAFTLSVLDYTHPEQPLSSRLSLAQAVVSAGAQSKAKSIGLVNGLTAEEDGWAQGQPKLRIMGREVAVMRRQVSENTNPAEDTQEIVVGESGTQLSHEAFWGIDLEALRKSNGPLIAGKNQAGQRGPPIHTPDAARNYLLRSMDTVLPGSSSDSKSPQSKKQSTAEIANRKEETAAAVLKSIAIVLDSWKDTLSTIELDRRAQSWYAIVRPEVAQGKAGWGQRGQLALQDIIRLKRTP